MRALILLLVVALADVACAQCFGSRCGPPAAPPIVYQPITTYQPMQLQGWTYSQRRAPIATAWARFWQGGRWQAQYVPVQQSQQQQPSRVPDYQPKQSTESPQTRLRSIPSIETRIVVQ